MSLTQVGSALTTTRTAVLTVLTIALIGGTTMSAQSVRHVIRDHDGAAACAVGIPDARSSNPDADRVGVDIRVPATPVSAQLAKLPATRRDYSNLPIQVTLIPTRCRISAADATAWR